MPHAALERCLRHTTEGKYGGTEVKYSGEEYLILSARDVLAVVS